MGQEEIYNYLKEKKEPLSRTEIADATGVNKLLVSSLLNKLVKAKEVDYVELDRIQAMERTGHLGKHKVRQRMRLFYAI
jgi:Mn-dependent DtxR family transcriptional regulator